MTMLALNFPLLLVFQLAALQFFFWHRENLLHRFAEFFGCFFFFGERWGRRHNLFSFLFLWCWSTHFSIAYKALYFILRAPDKAKLRANPQFIDKIGSLNRDL